MRTCDLCGAEVPKELEACSRCGFVFQKEIRADVRDRAILKAHAGKSVDAVNRDMKNARAQLSAYLENLNAKSLSKEELSSLLDDALSFLRIPLELGVGDELRFDAREKEFISMVAGNLERADLENGGPVGTPGTYIRISNALLAMEEPDRAMSMIDKALLLNPRDSAAMFSRAKLLFYAKKYALAKKCLEKIVAACDHENAKYLIELIEQMSPGKGL
ncbi:MAG: hypothetical protein R6W91_05915 [Thermoplasmata archaeon]